MNLEERVYYLAFSLVFGLGPARFKLLKDYFGGVKKAFLAPEAEVRKTGLPKQVLEKYIWQQKNFQPERYLEMLQQREIGFITMEDKDYPSLLKQIVDPPIAIFYKGKNLLSEETMKIGVVGTRKMTSYGKEITELLVKELVLKHLVIVSGMALGIDGCAHKTAIENKGETIAVLGAGVDIIYPREHTRLYYDIINSGGMIVSEVPPGKFVGKGIFPARNRIISGLSKAVLVIEGTEDSGSLITARLALEQEREVLAVPGPVTSPYSQGPLSLIKNGAKLVTNANDIFEEIGLRVENNIYKREKRIPTANNPTEQKIIDMLQSGSREFDEIIRQLDLTVADLASTLSLMEINNQVVLKEGKYELNYC